MNNPAQPPGIPAPAKTSSMAIWSLVLGILSFCCLGFLTAIPGLILGIAGTSRINKSGGSLAGGGLAVAGIVTSAVGMIFGTAIIASIAVPVLNEVTERARLTRSQVNVRLIALACRSYALDHEGRLPANFEVLVSEGFLEDGDVLVSPFSKDASEKVSYELLLAGKKTSDYPEPERTVLLSDRHPNASGQIVVAMLDGSARIGQAVGKAAPPGKAVQLK